MTRAHGADNDFIVFLRPTFKKLRIQVIDYRGDPSSTSYADRREFDSRWGVGDSSTRRPTTRYGGAYV